MPTIDDVARACRVSKATVSKALDQRPGPREVSAATRARIIATATALGYEPAWRLRQRARRRSGNIGLVYAARSPVQSGVYDGFAHAVADALAADDRRLFFVPLSEDSTQWHRALTDQRIDGCLVIDPAPAAVDRLLAIAGVPTVLINQVSSLGIPQVRADDARAIHMLVAHCQDLGHRRLAYVMRPRLGHPSEQARQDAFRAAAPQGSPLWIEELAGIPVRCRGADAPTALIAYNAHDGIDIVRLLTASGLQVPRDITLVACDDTLEARLVQPALTVVDTPMLAMGVRAAEIVEELIEGRRQPGPDIIVLAGQLHIRGSSAPPPMAISARRGKAPPKAPMRAKAKQRRKPRRAHG